MSKIFWDSNLFIYLFEQHPVYLKPVQELRIRMLGRGDQLVTSTMTLGEVQTKSLRLGKTEEAALIRNAVMQAATVVTFDTKAADAYAVIRSKTSIRGADAIQLACAAASGVELFITNDRQLQSLTIAGIHFITSLDHLPF